MSILELLQHIVNEPAPRLTPEGRFPKEADDFVDSCLLKDPDARKTPKDLLVSLICKLQLKIFEKPPSSSLLVAGTEDTSRDLPRAAKTGIGVGAPLLGTIGYLV